MDRAEILKNGKVKIRVKRSGMYQQIEFVVERINSPMGIYPVLKTDKFIDLSEGVRIAEELMLPVKTKNGVFFPRGKGAGDFVGL
ncbi:MAG: hypothetical protein QXP42_05800 [Candidatus Micrarchaeia archaeon]